MKNHHQVTHTLAAMLALVATPVIAQTAVEQGTSPQQEKLRVVSTQAIADGGNASVIQLKVENGKISVRHNGKDVPADRIRTEDEGRIIILDENGNEIDNVRLFTGVGQDGSFFMGRGAGEMRFMEHGVRGEGQLFWHGDGDDTTAPKVMVGVHMAEPGEALEKHLRLTPGKSAIITGVFQGLPADLAGIGEHDIIVRIDGSDDADAATIQKILASKEPGDTCTLRVIQAGEPRDITIRLLARDQKKLSSAKLLGKEPGDKRWSTTFEPFDGFTVDLRGLENIPQLRDRVFVAPGELNLWREQIEQIRPRIAELEPWIAELQPMIAQALQDALRLNQGATALNQGKSSENGKAGDVESQLDRLDKRMAQLEEMLQKLLERQPKP